MPRTARRGPFGGRTGLENGTAPDGDPACGGNAAAGETDGDGGRRSFPKGSGCRRRVPTAARDGPGHGAAAPPAEAVSADDAGVAGGAGRTAAKGRPEACRSPIRDDVHSPKRAFPWTGRVPVADGSGPMHSGSSPGNGSGSVLSEGVSPRAPPSRTVSPDPDVLASMSLQGSRGVGRVFAGHFARIGRFARPAPRFHFFLSKSAANHNRIW